MPDKMKSVEKVAASQPAQTFGGLRSPAPAEQLSMASERNAPQAVGNMAMQRWLRSGAIQARLTVSQPDDPCEQEADRVAEAATQARFPLFAQFSSVSERTRGVRVQRVCAVNGVADSLCPENQEIKGKMLQKKEAGNASVHTPDFSDLQALGSSSPLSSKVKEKVEPLLGVDLSPVRVHTGPAAHEAAAGLHAKAFTQGSHIWLGANQSADDVSLLAHEATHVVQQTTGKLGRGAGTIQRFFWGHTQHPNQPAYPRPPEPYPAGTRCDQRALAAMLTETVDLKGTPEFRPSYWLAEGLHCVAPDPVWVRVRFGALASGAIRVRELPPPPTMTVPGAPSPRSNLYETVDDLAFIDLTHPAFPGGGRYAPPRMYLTIRESVVTGRVSFIPWGMTISYDELSSFLQAQTLERALGWRGLIDVRPTGVVNEVRGGVLRFALQNFTFGMQDLQSLGGVMTGQADYTGTGNFSVTDEAISFSAETLIQAEGITDSRMPLHHANGRIFGSASVNLALAPRDAFGGTFSGSLQGSYANGVMTITGAAQYRSRRLNGSVTVLVAPRAVAWTEVLRQLPTGAPGVSTGEALTPGHVVVGWGSLDFHINEWLTGHASVVVDPDGYITSHGILRPTREYQFLSEPGRYEINRPVGPHLSATATFATIGIASLNGAVEADLRAGGRIGPARLYGLEIEGQFSTRPGTVFTGRITGRANLSAQASVAASLTGSLSGSIGSPPAHVRVVTVALNIVGQATLRAYAELQPTFERIAGPNPDEAQYRITGTLTAAGAVDLGLRGSVRFSIVGVGPRINLGRVQYPLGSVGVQATISHILGSGDPIEADVTAADFNEAQYTGFIQDLFDEDAPANVGDHEAELGQAGSRPPAETPHPTELRTSLMMNGTPHTLWLEHAPGPTLKMASNGDDSLDTKLRNEIAVVEQQRQTQQGNEAELLANEAQSARSLLARSVSVERSLGELESETRANPDVAGFNELASGLSAYATQYGKNELASTPPSATTTGAQARTDERGRYIIKNRDDLAAVRAAKPARPGDLPPELEGMWQRYAGPGGYFDEAVRLIEQDLNRPNYRVRHDPPLSWPAYIEARGFYDQLSARKEFQAELRQSILNERGDVDPTEAEIDVGLQKGNRRVRYADLVVSDSLGNLEVYSVKVHNVYAQTQRLPSEQAVRDWIRDTLSADINEAVDYYGGQLTYRRQYRSTPEGRAGRSASGPNPRFNQRVFVNRVILVWRGNSDLVPEAYRQYILDTGRDIGVTRRASSRIKCEVRLVP